MRILQVITDTDRRGAQVFATDLAVAMAEEGHHVTTVALREGTQRPRLEVEVLGRRSRGLPTLWRLRQRMSAAEITIAHGSSTGLACALAGGTRHPFVYRQISDTRFWANTPLRRWRVARYLRRADAVVALSEGAKADLIDHLGLSAGLIHVIPNGVPRGEFRPYSLAERNEARRQFGLCPELPVVLMIGALVSEKGTEVAIRAIATLESIQLLVVGDGPLRAELEGVAGKISPGRVRFLGVISEVAHAYAAADLVVLPSRGGDSMPATLIEAGLCGLATIATSVGSIEDIVVDGVTGLIIPMDDVDALGATIARLTVDESTRGALGARAAEHCVAHFEITAVSLRWLALLRLTVGESGR